MVVGAPYYCVSKLDLFDSIIMGFCVVLIMYFARRCGVYQRIIKEQEEKIKVLSRKKDDIGGKRIV